MAGHVGLTGTAAAEPELLESRRAPDGSHRRRWPWWVLAVAVVAAVTCRPAMDWLAREQTRQLAEVWAVRSAYQADRLDAMQQLTARLVVGEERTFAETVAAMDLEQAQRLRSLSRRLEGQAWRTFADDVQAAADHARAAIDTEIETLEREIDTVSSSGTGEIPVYDGATIRALLDVSSEVELLAARRHVALPPTRHATFVAVDQLMSRLNARIAPQVPLRAVLVTAPTSSVIALTDGTVTRLAVEALPSPAPIVVLAPTAASSAGELALQESGAVVAVPLDGSAPRPLGPGLVVPRAGGTGWLFRGLEVSVLAAGEAPEHVGRLPADANPTVTGQPRDRIVIGRDGGPALWDPRTGAETAFGDAGCAHVIGAAETKVVWLPCAPAGPQPWVEVVDSVGITDVATGRTQRVQLDRRLSAVRDEWQTSYAVRPDGAGLAVTTGYPQQTWWVDLRTGTTRPVQAGGKALAWSPDGRWLLVAVRAIASGGTGVISTGHQSVLLRLWSPTGAVVTAARPLVDDPDVIGGLLP